jgi:hypothetical protein
LLAAARAKAFTLKNIRSGFRASGIWPYNPDVILQNLELLEPVLVVSPTSIPPILARQLPVDYLLNFNLMIPTTPRSLHNMHMIALSTLDTTSPCAIMLRTLFTKLTKGAERNAASVVMHQAGGRHLREKIIQRNQKGKIDTRHINTNSVCIIERETVLAELKQNRDEKEAEDEANRLRQEEEKQRREIEKLRKADEKCKKAEERKRKN